jgi:CAAX protease family protein
VLALTEGKRGLIGLFSRMIRWRVPAGWYAIALFLPPVLAATATVLNILLGAEPPSATELNGWTGLFSTFAILLLIPGFGGAWEEPGWRGYALPRLQSRRSALLAGLILGALIAGWHLPLMVADQVAYSDIVLIFAGTIVFNWVFNNARGSVLIIMVM